MENAITFLDSVVSLIFPPVIRLHVLQSAALLWADLSRKKELERHGKGKQTDVKEEAVRQRWTDFLFQLLQENSDSFQAPPQKKWAPV